MAEGFHFTEAGRRPGSQRQAYAAAAARRTSRAGMALFGVFAAVVGGVIFFGVRRASFFFCVPSPSSRARCNPRGKGIGSAVLFACALRIVRLHDADAA
eukprot:CAMPEP_0174891506 /NCGR_PEP_ID=MMETSP0167-20121228/6572_1 /TAXON_ID=38298 /ORGANISM="Rhodella maculata, Strain CCMP736" /LENGTH=98 /DNA_ID=CAMNT_0016129711 /DNA_START=8 /DNA_END=300 /DNA_ORIENTATION=+